MLFFLGLLLRRYYEIIYRKGKFSSVHFCRLIIVENSSAVVPMPSSQFELRLSNTTVGQLDVKQSSVMGIQSGYTKVTLVDKSILQKEEFSNNRIVIDLCTVYDVIIWNTCIWTMDGNEWVWFLQFLSSTKKGLNGEQWPLWCCCSALSVELWIRPTGSWL